MFKLRLVSEKTSVPFMRWRFAALVTSSALAVASVVIFLAVGLNYGIDFRGGIMIEARTPPSADTAAVRASLSSLGLGEVALQEFGAPNDVLIRIERQPGDATAQQKAIDVVKEALARDIGAGIEYRRVEFVGPQVSRELVTAGATALALALIAMLIYIWFRFEWQFALGSVVALIHDVLLTIGLFAVVRLEFNLSIIAAVLAIIGYSMNDTVVVYDRVRENLRKYKAMPLVELLDVSVNDTLSRTTMTSATTLLALAALYLFGGEVIAGFTLAMIWGVIIGTYSSVFIAAPILTYFKLRPAVRAEDTEPGTQPA